VYRGRSHHQSHRAQIFVAVLGASSYTFAWTSLTQTLPDWIEVQVRALKFFGGVHKAIVCDNLTAAVAKPLYATPKFPPTAGHGLSYTADTTLFLINYSPGGLI
jgi:transposase